ncbi:A2M domain-containing protein [Aphelenchoides besseyi]|nr:A2M domain-containing protein [Aphelenchoides besseyi]
MKWFCVVILFTFISRLSSAKPQPIVILPSSILWNADNTIIITPTPNSYASTVDISILLRGKNVTNNDGSDFKRWDKPRVKAGEPTELKFPVNRKAEVYHLTIKVSGHSDFDVKLRGRPNVENVFLLSDKTFYKPNETVHVCSLPLTAGGSIFRGKLKYVLQDPNGFSIRTLTQKASNGFLDLTFNLPFYVRHGNWRVIAFAQLSSFPLGEVAFQVQEYVLPKFHVTVDVNDNNVPNDNVLVTVLAKFPRGSLVNGDLLVFCATSTERSNATGNEKLNKITLVNTKIANGHWSQTLNIRQCYTESGTRIQITAEVHEADTFRTERGIEYYEVLKPGFEVITARPAVVRGTKKIVLYIRPLSNDTSIKESEVFVNFFCISDDRNQNGYQRNHSGYKLGGYLALDFDVNPSCIVHLFKVYRKLTDSVLSREETIAIPTLLDSSNLKMSWIESADPAKVVYHEGDSFEAQITTSISDLNYVVVCSQTLVANGRVSASNRISVPIKSGMNGVCLLTVYKIESPKPKLDLWLFLAESSSCPMTYSASVSKSEVAVNQELTLRLEAANGAIALVRAMDARLAEMAVSSNSFRRHSIFTLNEFEANESKGRKVPILSGLMNKTAILEEICKPFHANSTDHFDLDQQCSLAGAYIPTSTMLKFAAASSSISNFCLGRIVNIIARRSAVYHVNGETGQLNDSQYKINMAHLNLFSSQQATQPPRVQNMEEKPTLMFERMEALEESNRGDQLLLRDFFPEVWMFEDFEFDTNSFIERQIQSPHSVTEWQFLAHFWAPEKRNVCRIPTLNVNTWRDVYIEVDLPSNVYENETVEFHLTVTADKLTTQKQYALCVSGFSPLVCGDMGPGGKTENADYSVITLNPQHLRVRKSFFVRFLREGTYDVEFHLLDRDQITTFGDGCGENDKNTLDKVKQSVRVLKRVDVDEHFRQIVIHKQRRSDADTANENRAAASTHGRLFSKPDIIQFTESALDNGTILSSVSVSSTERIYDLAMEFSEFAPTLPLRDFPKFVQMQNVKSQRKRRETTQWTSGGLSGVVKELAFVAFQSTNNGLNNDFDVTQQNDITVGNLLSELLTYSDCERAENPKACGFGEYGIPSSSEMRDVVLTSLATTLLCEKSASESLICGPVQFLADIIPKTSFIQSSFLDMLQFKSGKDSETFLRALLSWVGKECAAYSCVQQHDIWKTFLQREYSDDFESKDLRIEATLARLYPGGSASLIRQRLAENANPTKTPFWNVDTRTVTTDGQNSMDEEVQQSANVLLNSLAMLAFTSNLSVYDYWRSRFNFDLLADWLVEQQNGVGQYHNALDTYFGLKSLQVYRKLQLSESYQSNILVNVTASDHALLRRFDDHDLPLRLSVPPEWPKMEIRSYGDMRVIMGVRVLTEKRLRLKRNQNDNDPVTIKIKQRRENQFLIQRVTITSHRSMLHTLEIEHGIMTGFYTEPQWLTITANDVKTVISPRVGAASVNFVVSDLQKDREMVYEVRMSEPKSSYTLDNLAPFVITVRQHMVVGRLIVFARDLDFSSPEEDFTRRRRRYASPVSRLSQSANLIETVCVENGACTCAEATCDLSCQSCSSATVSDLCDEYNRPFGFVVVFKFETHREVTLDGNLYDVFDVNPSEWYGIERFDGKLTVWIRSCNTLCRRLTRDSTKGRYLLIGSSNGIFHSSVEQANGTDTSALHRHYLLRNGDRLAKASDCWALFSEFQDAECINNAH